MAGPRARCAAADPARATRPGPVKSFSKVLGNACVRCSGGFWGKARSMPRFMGNLFRAGGSPGPFAFPHTSRRTFLWLFAVGLAIRLLLSPCYGTQDIEW